MSEGILRTGHICGIEREASLPLNLGKTLMQNRCRHGSGMIVVNGRLVYTLEVMRRQSGESV